MKSKIGIEMRMPIAHTAVVLPKESTVSPRHFNYHSTGTNWFEELRLRPPSDIHRKVPLLRQGK